MEVIHIHFTPEQIKKLRKGYTVQLTAEQMSSKAGQSIEMHMLRKHGNEVRRAIKKGKSYRFSPKKIELNGGKLILSTDTVASETNNPVASKKKEKKVKINVPEALELPVPVITGSSAPKLKSALKPEVGIVKGQGNVSADTCKPCENKPKSNNGAENHMLLNRPTPRVHARRIPL